jgi:hypothetical protein
VAEVGRLAGRARAEPDAAVDAGLALRIGQYYTAVEAVMLRVAKVVDGVVPQGEEWHRDLLRQASLPIEGIRPHVVSQATAALLRPLMGFRHFLRHSYAVDLDAARLLHRADDVARAATAVRADVGAFAAFLRQVVSAGGGAT